MILSFHASGWVKCTVLLISLTVCETRAQWVRFDACGLMMPDVNVPITGDVVREKTVPAPTLGPHVVWVPSIIGVTGVTERVRHEHQTIPCSLVIVSGGRFLVVGSLAKVMGRIESARRKAGQ